MRGSGRIAIAALVLLGCHATVTLGDDPGHDEATAADEEEDTFEPARSPGADGEDDVGARDATSDEAPRDAANDDAGDRD